MGEKTPHLQRYFFIWYRIICFEESLVEFSDKPEIQEEAPGGNSRNNGSRQFPTSLKMHFVVGILIFV